MSTTAAVLFPIWSPDGRRIAFFGAPEQQEPGNIWTVSPDGTSLTRQTEIGFTDMLPAWSPDGAHIAFFGTADDGRRLYVVGSDGEVLTVLADSPAEAFAPSWSPDGTAIAYTDEDGEVIIVEINTGARRSTGEFG